MGQLLICNCDAIVMAVRISQLAYVLFRLLCSLLVLTDICNHCNEAMSLAVTHTQRTIT